MTTNEELDEKQIMAGVSIPVLDHGFVRVVDTMGDDSAIVQAARVSYGKGTKSSREDAELINYLMRHQHTSPFEMCQIKLHCKMPLFVARQWVRHRTASINEYSCRYSEAPEDVYMPELERIKVQSTDNKQGSGDGADLVTQEQFLRTTSSVQSVAAQALSFGEQKGVARELNRINMTVAHYTEWYWCINAHNLMHFLRLRLDPHAQEEMRAYAEVIALILKAWMPATYSAFLEYMLHRVTLSLKEQELIAPMLLALSTMIADAEMPVPEGFSKGEFAEFKKKIASIAELAS